MIRFVRTLAVFSIVLFAALIPADFALSRVMRGIKTCSMESWKDIMEGNASAEIVFQGNSRPFNACDKEVLDSIIGRTSFNAAIIGQQFSMQDFRYKIYRKYNSKPKLVVQFVDHYFLAHVSILADPVSFLPWMWDKAFFLGFRFVGPLLFLRESAPLVRYHGCRPWVSYKYAALTQDGFNMARDDGFLFVREDAGIFKFRKDTDSEFRDFLGRLSDDGIKVVLVIPPLREDFKFKEGETDKMEQYFNSISTEYGIPLYNCLSMEITHDSTYFRDKGHLNLKGAKVFTDSLSHFLIDRGLFED